MESNKFIEDKEIEIEKCLSEGIFLCRKNRTSEAMRKYQDALTILRSFSKPPAPRPGSTLSGLVTESSSCSDSDKSLLEFDCEDLASDDLLEDDSEDVFSKCSDDEFGFAIHINGCNVVNGTNGVINLNGFLNPPNVKSIIPDVWGDAQPSLLGPSSSSSVATYTSTSSLSSSPPNSSLLKQSNIDEIRLALLYSYVYYNIAFCNLMEGNFVEAEKNLMAALDQLPEQPLPFRVSISQTTSPLHVVSALSKEGESASPPSVLSSLDESNVPSPTQSKEIEEHRSSIYSLLGVVHQKQKRYNEAEGYLLMAIELRRLIGSKLDSASHCNLSSIYLVHGIEAINKAKTALHTMLTSKSVPPNERKRIREESRETFKSAKNYLCLAKRYAKLTKAYLQPNGEDDHLLAGSKRNLISIESCLEDIRLSKSGRKDALNPTIVFQNPKEFVSLMQLPITALKRAHRIQKYKKQATDLENRLAKERLTDLGNIDTRGYLLGERGSLIENKLRIQPPLQGASNASYFSSAYSDSYFESPKQSNSPTHTSATNISSNSSNTSYSKTKNNNSNSNNSNNKTKKAPGSPQQTQRSAASSFSRPFSSNNNNSNAASNSKQQYPSSSPTSRLLPVSLSPKVPYSNPWYQQGQIH